jgi:hypothetical protein
MWPDEVLCVHITCTDVSFEVMLYQNITTHTVMRLALMCESRCKGKGL